MKTVARRSLFGRLQESLERKKCVYAQQKNEWQRFCENEDRCFAK